MLSILSKLSLVAVLAFAAGLVSLQADEEQWGNQPQTVSVDDLEDGKIETFAAVYQEIIVIITEYEAKFAEAGDDAQQAANLQNEANQAMVEVIENEENLTIEEYNLIVTSMRTDEELHAAVQEHLDS